VAVIICGRYGLAVIVYLVAVVELFCGRRCLWPSVMWPTSYRPVDCAAGMASDVQKFLLQRFIK